MQLRAIGVIPARFKSTRLMGKPLIKIRGKTLIYYVYKRSSLAKEIDELIVATDDERIFQEVKSFGGNVVMTSPYHSSGSSRVAEVAENKEAEIIINIQGDELFIRGEMIDKLVEEMRKDDNLFMSTYCTRITDLDELDNPNIVKVITNKDGYAIYFSRNAIPYPMLDNHIEIKKVKEIVSYKNELINFYKKHIGIYGYRRNYLLNFAKLQETPLEKIEKLEQLRAIEYGTKIKVLETDYAMIGIDTEEDLRRVQRLLNAMPELILDN